MSSNTSQNDMTTTQSDGELDLYKLLEFVYNSGYNVGDGFKPTEMVSDLLHQRVMIIKDWHEADKAQAVRDARIDEVKGIMGITTVYAKYFAGEEWFAKMQHRIINRIKALQNSTAKGEGV